MVGHAGQLATDAKSAYRSGHANVHLHIPCLQATEMPNLIKYAALFIAVLIIIGVLVHYCLAKLYWHTPLDNVSHYDATKIEKLKSYSYYAVVFLGTFLVLHSALDFLFSWMPHRWGVHDEDGEWRTTAELLSMLGAFFGMLALLFGFEITVEKISELQSRQTELRSRQTKADAFKKMIAKELSNFARISKFPAKDAADSFVKLEQEIDEAEKTFVIYREDANVGRQLIDVFRRAYVPPSEQNTQ